MIFETRGAYLEFNETAISGKTKVYCLIGDPVDHSMSPAIQNAALRSAGIDAVYLPFRVSKRELKTAISGLRAAGVQGFNVTAPHKIHVISHLNKLDSTAAEVGAVNTVTVKNKRLTGFNTDGIGAVRALNEAGANLRAEVLLFGAGGAGRAIAHALAPHAKSIMLVNRTVSSAKELAQRLRKRYRVNVLHRSLRGNIRDLIDRADIVVNASSMGMSGRAEIPIEEEWLSSDQSVMDIVYKPLQTGLLKFAEKAGARTVNGLDMLLGQGACSFELFTGQVAPIADMRRALAGRTVTLSHAYNS